MALGNLLWVALLEQGGVGPPEAPSNLNHSVSL